MLPPVIAVPSSQISYQDQRPFIEITGNAHASSAATQMVAPSTLEQSAVAGRLNILLLTGRERLAENLAMIAEIFGTAVGITRKEGESSVAFAARLAEAIAALPLSQRLKLEGQLARVLAGVQLRMLLAALKNPEGSDAAKVSLLIELARAKERDLAARSVVTSYRQNAAEPRNESLQPWNAGKPANAPVAETETESALDPQQPSLVSDLAPSEAATADETAAKAAQLERADDTADLYPAKADEAQPANAADAAAEPTHQAEQVADAAEQPIRTASQADAPAASVLTDRQQAERSDAQGLQALLQRSFSVEALDAVTDEPALARPTPAAPLAAVAEAPAEELEPLQDMPQAAAAEMEEYSPRSELRRNSDTSKTMNQPQTTLLVLKGWREVDDLVPVVLDDLSEAPGRALVAQAIQAAGGHEPESLDMALREMAQPQSMDERKRHDVVLSAWDGEQAEATGHDGAPLRSFPETILSQWRALDEQLNAMRPPLDLPDGAVLPVVSYLFAEDVPEEEAASERSRQRHGDGSQDGESDQQTSGGSGEGTKDQERSGQEPQMDAAAADDQGNDGQEELADAERANDLYWRMAGWS